MEKSSHRKIFDIPAKTGGAAAEAEATEEGITSKSEKWWAFVDKYRTLCLMPDPEFRSLVDDFRCLKIAS